MTLTDLYQTLRRKGFRICFQELLKRVWPIYWTRNASIITQILQERHYNSLKRKYNKLAAEPIKDETAEEPTKIIWICWLQGLEAAPALVKHCYSSVRQYCADYEVRLITNDNLLTYIHLPEYIVSKYHEGKISFTHFSDILRTCLCLEYGGVWLDATVLLTAPINPIMLNSPLFMFRKSWLQNSPSAISSWFIVARKGHPVLQKTRDLLFEYWREHNSLNDYYLFHLCLTLAINENALLKELFNRMPYFNNAAPHSLQFNLQAEFDKEQYDCITQQSSIHKLTYKNPPIVAITAKGQSFLDYILNS